MASPLAPTITGWINFVLLIVTVVVEVTAFVHCVSRKPDAFLAIGNIPKSGWVAMTGAALLFTVLIGATAFSFSPLALLGVIALVIALVYLLDVRPALRDAVDGRGNW
ncbi:MAG TPA: DUF2516 family protein [Micromonosporaceae bacterium]|nr:DUF2516 family protein [Micromonosporaceae bacterium]